nr:PfkB family carbohydrate kinase [Caldilineaceae bacterium]
TAGQIIRVPAAKLNALIEPTGAGDAFRGGFFAAQLAGLPLEVAGQVGSLCSAYSLENLGPTAHRFTWEEFVDRFRQNFGSEPAIEKLRA